MTTTISLFLAVLAQSPRMPTCRTSSALVEATVETKVRELRGHEYCQYRLYNHIDDVDGDGREDFLMVFSVEGVNGTVNDARQFLAAFGSRSHWRPSIVEVGQRGIRVILGLEVENRAVVLTTAERNDGDALCCLSGSGKRIFRVEQGKLVLSDQSGK